MPPKQDGSAPDLDAKAILGASIVALDDLQDFLCHELREPWPRRAPGEVPAPGARIERGKLHLWYGDELEPVLQLPPIDVGPVRDAVWTEFPEAR